MTQPMPTPTRKCQAQEMVADTPSGKLVPLCHRTPTKRTNNGWLVCDEHARSIITADLLLMLTSPHHVSEYLSPIDEPISIIQLSLNRLEFRLLIESLSAVTHFVNGQGDEVVESMRRCASVANLMANAPTNMWEELMHRIAKLGAGFPGVDVRVEDVTDETYTRDRR